MRNWGWLVVAFFGITAQTTWVRAADTDPRTHTAGHDSRDETKRVEDARKSETAEVALNPHETKGVDAVGDRARRTASQQKQAQLLHSTPKPSAEPGAPPKLTSQGRASGFYLSDASPPPKDREREREDEAARLIVRAISSSVERLDAKRVKALTSHESYEVAASFDGPIWRAVLHDSLRLLRIQPENGNPDARWYLCCETVSSDGIREVDVSGRALPPWNTQRILTTVEIPAGTEVLVGRAADQTYELRDGRKVTTYGGAYQFYLPALPAERDEHRYERLDASEEPSAATLAARGKTFIRATLQTDAPDEATRPSVPASTGLPPDAAPREQAPPSPRTKLRGTPAWFRQISLFWRRGMRASCKSLG